MKKGNVCVGIAIAIAMTAVLAISGCVDIDVGDKEYPVGLMMGEKTPVAPDSNYALLLRSAQTDEVFVGIFRGRDSSYNISVRQTSLETGKAKTINGLTLRLESVNPNGGYADIIVNEKIDVIGYGEKVVGVVGDIAESIAETQS